MPPNGAEQVALHDNLRDINYATDQISQTGTSWWATGIHQAETKHVRQVCEIKTVGESNFEHSRWHPAGLKKEANVQVPKTPHALLPKPNGEHNNHNINQVAIIC